MNRTLFHTLLCSLIGIYSTILAQTGMLKGSVKDSLGEPVESANIQIQNTKLITTTDAKGNYQFANLPTGAYTVLVTILGYKSVSEQVRINENETSQLNFKLSQKIQRLKEISINSSISGNGMGNLGEEHDGLIYSGKKTEVLALDSIDANTAQDNPREVLGRIPGSNYSETEGGGFPSNGIALRGLRPIQSTEIQTRQNGYNIVADLYGYPETYYMPPLEGLQRIEVIRGASSLQYGAQFGGVINYIMKDGPTDKPLEVTVTETAGSYGFYNSFTSIGGTYKKWHYYTFVQYKSSLGYRPNSDMTQVSGFGKIEYTPSDKFKIGLEYSLLRNRIHMAGGLDDAEFDQNPEQSVRARNWLQSPWNILALTAEYKPSDKTIFTLKSAFNLSARDLVWRNEDGGIQTPDTISAITKQYIPREVEHEGFESVTTELRMLTHYKLWGTDQTLAAGTRYFQGYMKREESGPGSTGSDFDLNLYGGTYGVNLDFNTFNIAPFFENTFHIGQLLSVTPGFRFDVINSTARGYITDPNSGAIVNVVENQTWKLPLEGLGIQLKTSNTTNIYANISSAYEPTTYANLTPLGSSLTVDPNLKDVSGYNADIGWRGRIKSWLNFDAGLFYMAFNSEIGTELIHNPKAANPADTLYTYTTNVGNAVHEGVESYIEINPFKKFAGTSKVGTISFFNSYSYILASYVSGPYKGNLEEEAPKNINRFGINYTIKRFSTTFLISNQSKSFADAANTVFSPDATVGIIPAYQVLDWSNTLRIKNFTIKMGISNLANTKYFNLRTDEYPGPGIIPAMPRYFYFGLGGVF